MSKVWRKLASKARNNLFCRQTALSIFSSVAHTSDPKAEFERLRHQSERVRADAIRSRIMVTHAFCAIAEAEINRDPDRAKDALSKVRRSIDELQRHISDPNHVSSTAAEELTEQLSALKARASLIENPL